MLQFICGDVGVQRTGGKVRKHFDFLLFTHALYDKISLLIFKQFFANFCLYTAFRAVADFLDAEDLRGRVDGFITLHTYAQMWIHPFSHEIHNYPHDINQVVVQIYSYYTYYLYFLLQSRKILY